MSNDDLKTLIMNTEEQAYEEFKMNLGLKEFHERMAEKYKKKTQEYIYRYEGERIVNRKVDSDRYYRELETKLNQE
jgi:hypothetical protein